LMLLALLGYPEVMSEILHAMERPESAECAAQAWFWMTGETLPQRPRMEVAEAGGAQGGGTLPDTEWAAGWWHTHRNRFAADSRVLFGKGMNADNVVDACRRWSGRRSRDLFALAVLSGHRDMNIHHEDWIVRRLSVLQGFARAEPDLPEELSERDAWERGHFASKQAVTQ